MNVKANHTFAEILARYFMQPGEATCYLENPLYGTVEILAAPLQPRAPAGYVGPQRGERIVMVAIHLQPDRSHDGRVLPAGPTHPILDEYLDAVRGMFLWTNDPWAVSDLRSYHLITKWDTGQWHPARQPSPAEANLAALRERISRVADYLDYEHVQITPLRCRELARLLRGAPPAGQPDDGNGKL